MLGALGGLGGILLAAGALALLKRAALQEKDLLGLVSLDPQLLLYASGLAIASGLVFGCAPALQLLRQTQSAAMARSQRRVSRTSS